MSRNRLLSLCLSAVLLLFMTTCANAVYAQDCQNLQDNELWKQNFELLKVQIDSHSFDQALETSQKLFAICYNSPILYMYTGTIFKNMDDSDRAMKYFDKAAELEANSINPVPEAKEIWYNLFQEENPGSSLDVVRQNEKAMDEMSTKIVELEQKNQELENVIELTNADDVKKMHQIFLWSGVGAAVAGLALTGAGAGIIGKLNSDKSKKLVIGDENEKGERPVTINESLLIGYTSLGLGLSLTAVGAILAGYHGYKYSQFSKSKDSSQATNDISFQLGLNSAQLNVTF